MKRNAADFKVTPLEIYSILKALVFVVYNPIISTKKPIIIFFYKR